MTKSKETVFKLEYIDNMLAFVSEEKRMVYIDNKGNAKINDSFAKGGKKIVEKDHLGRYYNRIDYRRIARL